MYKFKTSLSKEDTLKACDGFAFYHRYDFDNGAVIQGDWDISLDVADYGFPSSAVDAFFHDKPETPIYLATGQCLVIKKANADS